MCMIVITIRLLKTALKFRIIWLKASCLYVVYHLSQAIRQLELKYAAANRRSAWHFYGHNCAESNGSPGRLGNDSCHVGGSTWINIMFCRAPGYRSVVSSALPVYTHSHTLRIDLWSRLTCTYYSHSEQPYIMALVCSYRLCCRCLSAAEPRDCVSISYLCLRVRAAF